MAVKRSTSIACAAFAAVLSVATTLAHAQYPAKPVRFVVPYAPGGLGDILARQISPRFGELLGQQVLVDNRAGSGAIMGTDLAAHSAPDGYTIYLSTDGPISINPSLYAKLPYDPVKDFAPISRLATARQVLVVNAGVPARTVAELGALSRTQAGKLNYASFGSGSLSHLATEMYKSLSGANLTHVPFKGTAQALQAVVAGDVQLMFVGEPAAVPHVKAGRLRALATSGTSHSKIFPDQPTMSEAGVAGYDVLAIFGLMVPAGTPKEIIARLNSDVAKVLITPEVIERTRSVGFELQGSTPEQFGALVVSEIAKWGKVVRFSGAKPD